MLAFQAEVLAHPVAVIVVAVVVAVRGVAALVLPSAVGGFGGHSVVQAVDDDVAVGVDQACAVVDFLLVMCRLYRDEIVYPLAVGET